MKTLPCPYRNMKTLVYLQKHSLYSGWQKGMLRFSQDSSTRVICSSYLHGNSRCCYDTDFRSHHTNSQLLTLNKQESKKDSCNLFLQRGFHSLVKSCVSSKVSAVGLKDLYSRHTVISSRGSSRSSGSHDEERENEEKLQHKYMMEKLAIENGMLSWFRNTYILTLVSLTSLQFDSSQFPPSVIGAFAVTTAMMNLTVATGKYITTFLKLRRTDRLHGTPWQGHVAFAVVHYVLFFTVLWAIFPGVGKTAEDWKDYKGKDV